MNPGYKTTEFWLTLIAIIVGALAGAGIFPIDSSIGKTIGVVGTVLGALGYTAMRTSAKNAIARGTATPTDPNEPTR